MPIWEPQQLDADTCYETKIGLLRLWLKHRYKDWYVAWRLDGFSSRRELLRTYQRPVRKEPPDLSPDSWNRWVFESGTHTARFVPLTPDRGLVVQPDLPTHIPPGQRALVFVTVPLWIGVCVGEGAGQILCEVPTTALSNTWYGDLVSGELCYSLRSRATRELPLADHALHSAVCPVHLSNAGAASLDLVHLLIHSGYLSLYEVPGRIWTSPVEVLFQGQESQTTMGTAAPGIEGEAKLLQPARRVAERSLVRRSFQFLKSLAGFQG